MKIVGLGLCLLMAFACKKDEDISNCSRLEGTWQCSSWMEDDLEFLGATEFINAADIKFEALTGDQGDYEMNVTYQIGGSEMIIGSYKVNEACTKVTITPKAGLPATYDFSFDGDMLTLSGNVNAVDIELVFNKE
jgi:hypothetical protein